MESVAIVGVGLIGASFGLALRKSGFTGEIIGVSSEKAIAAALASGAISLSAPLAEAVHQADLVYLAQPVDRILTTIPQLAATLRPGTLVTDAGSTKQEIVARALAHLPVGSFLGGHPIAGKERRGPEAAEADLFCNRLYVLTPVDPPNPHLGALTQLLSSLGAIVLEMSPLEHDTTLAFTSHLPQLISTALAATLQREQNRSLTRVYGSGLIDMTRLALSSSDLWSSILSTNKTQVVSALESFILVLTEMKENLAEREIANTFDQAVAFSTVIRKISHTTK